MDYELPPKIAMLTWRWCAAYIGAMTPKDRLAASKAYFDARDATGQPIAGVELDGMMKIIERDTAGTEAPRAEAEAEARALAAAKLSVTPSPEDECESMLGPDEYKKGNRLTPVGQVNNASAGMDG